MRRLLKQSKFKRQKEEVPFLHLVVMEMNLYHSEMGMVDKETDHSGSEQGTTEVQTHLHGIRGLRCAEAGR